MTDKIGHEWVKGTTIEPTKETEGYTEYTCNNCGETEKRDIVPVISGTISDEDDIPAHEDGSQHDWIMTGKEYSPCDADGEDVTKVTYTCSICKNKKHEQNVDFGHGNTKEGFSFDTDGNLWYYEDGICKDCGMAIDTSSNVSSYKGSRIYDYKTQNINYYNDLRIEAYSFSAINKIVLYQFHGKHGSYTEENEKDFTDAFFTIMNTIFEEFDNGNVYVFADGVGIGENDFNHAGVVSNDYYSKWISQYVTSGKIKELNINRPTASYGKNNHVCNFTKRILREQICQEGLVKYFCPECYHTEMHNTHAEHEYQNGVCIRCGENEELVAGVYNADGDLLMSTDELIENGWDTSISYTSTDSAKKDFRSLYSVLEKNNILNNVDKIILDDGFMGSDGALITHNYNFAGLEISELVLPDIKKLYSKAFAGLTANRIVIPDSCVSVRGFEESHISNIIFGKGINSIESTNGFKGLKELKTITFLSDSITIGNSAFSNCTDLSKISISADNITIGDSAFSNCTALAEVSGLSENSVIGDSAFYNTKMANDMISETGFFILFGHLISSNKSLSGSITIPDKVSVIEKNAFSSNSKITEVILPDSLKEIKDNAFEECKGLTSITGLNDEIKIGIKAFYKTPWLSAMANQAENGMFVRNGILMGISDSLSGTVTIPSNVVKIDGYVFYLNKNVTNVIIPSSVKTIGNFAFGGAKITELTVPDTVEEISSGAFYGISHVTYHGTATGSWGQTSLN